MAVAVDATSASAYPASHPITISHVVGAGANRLLVVGVTQGGSTPPSISSVTYGGVALTQAAINSDSGDLVALYYLVAPTSGTANIVVTLSGTGGTFGAFGISFTGVDQTLPIDVTNTAVQAFGVSNNYSEPITTIAANAYLVDVVAQQWSGTIGSDTPGGSQTSLLAGVVGASFTAGFGSYKSVGAAGPQTMTWASSNTGSSQFVSAVASIQPVSAGVGSKGSLLLLGVGT